MADKRPIPPRWNGPEEKGSVMSKQSGRRSVNKADGDEIETSDRRNAIEL